MIFLDIFNIIIWAFLGYVVGRWSDMYLNVWLGDPIWAPHHWIYGFLMVVLGPFFLTGIWGVIVPSFGIGLFVSDLKDFLEFKFFSKDNKTKDQLKFWDID